MAVTKIRKISSWILWAVAAISIAVFLLFYFGGQTENSQFAAKELNDPKYTNQLLFWAYTVFALAIVSLLGGCIKI
jgi:magnesium-transporting ATPase (P-type)